MAIVIGIMAMATTYSAAMALEQKTVTDGLTACVNWCTAHNPAGANRDKCSQNCQKYWYCNGRDAARWTTQCQQARASITRVPQRPPPPPPPATRTK